MKSYELVELLEEKKVRFVTTDDDFFDQVNRDEKIYWGGENPYILKVLQKAFLESSKSDFEYYYRAAAILQQAYSLGYYKVNWKNLLDLPLDLLCKTLEVRYNEIKRLFPKIIERWDNEQKKSDGLTK